MITTREVSGLDYGTQSSRFRSTLRSFRRQEGNEGIVSLYDLLVDRTWPLDTSDDQIPRAPESSLPFMYLPNQVDGGLPDRSFAHVHKGTVPLYDNQGTGDITSRPRKRLLTIRRIVFHSGPLSICARPKRPCSHANPDRPSRRGGLARSHPR